MKTFDHIAMRKIINNCLFSSILAPTGNLSVGVEYLDLYDESRESLENSKGWLVPIVIYFPTKKSTKYSKKSKIHTPSPRRIEMRSIPVWDHVDYNIYSTPENLSEILPGSWPLVILNHGFTASSTDYSALAEDLASHGYIVVSILHQLETDSTEGPHYRRDHSILLYARVIENILFVFDWLNSKENLDLRNNLNVKNVCLMGHSMGSNAILLMLNRTSGAYHDKEKRFVLPHTEVNSTLIKECAVLMDFNRSLAYPNNNNIPILFQISQERQEDYQGSGLYSDIQSIGHEVVFYKSAKHISFLDHGYLEPKNHQKSGVKYFSGTLKERQKFFNQIRTDSREFLNRTFGIKVRDKE